MSDIVIKAENLGKRYTIGHQSENGRYLALRDVLVQNARSLWHKTKDLVQGRPILQGDTLEEVWALNDVSFEIGRGETVGIIGRNGAGKSTLLKVLSRITEPSAGRVTIKGRVASLLEVGTGFHPELTGRENIYLNGAILGMHRAEIKRKFDEIVAFAEIEKFLDTPVKRYSSGMYVRLAFAVAAHLEPETLLVDEVLAVGDAEFQKKCLGKMEGVAREGRTVLLVSHNMAAIRQLCNQAILLNTGNLQESGKTADVLETYSGKNITLNGEIDFPNNSCKDKDFKFLSLRVLNAKGDPSAIIDRIDGVTIEIDYEIYNCYKMGIIQFSLSTEDGSCLLTSANIDTKSETVGFERTVPGIYSSRIYIGPDFFRIGRYYVSLMATIHGVRVLDNKQEAICFEIISQYNALVDAGPQYGRSGLVNPILKWKIIPKHNSI
jgi:lipopolysaccharide transport system ATP-binding protein